MTEELNTEEQCTEKQARLRDIFKIFSIGLIAFAIACFIGKYTTGLIPFVIYLGFGIYLTKVYLPQMITFHPIYATIDNLVGVKIKAILFWPIFYLFLLLKLGFLHTMK